MICFKYKLLGCVLCLTIKSMAYGYDLILWHNDNVWTIVLFWEVEQMLKANI
jgi:hypothetical protein